MKRVIAYHVILSTYGFWLPNDPRGSWSDWVRKWELLRSGPATKVDTNRSLADRVHDWRTRLKAKEALDRPPVIFDGLQARAVARGFWEFVQKSKLVVWACAIMPDHAHLVVGRHRFKIEQVMNLLKGAATRKLVEEELHPFLEELNENGKVPKCWARKGWSVFLDEPEDIVRSIRYVENNPLKEGHKAQQWNFVTDYHPNE